MAPDRAFRPPDTVPSHVGTMWLNADGTVGIEIADVFNQPIRMVAVKEGAGYRVRGWRGEPPEFQRLPLIDDGTPPTGMPETACATCDGRLFWRASVAMGGTDHWHCVRCEPHDPAAWLDGCAIPVKPRVVVAPPVTEKKGTLL